MNIYEALINGVDGLRNEKPEFNGIDDFLTTDRTKVSSLDDLLDFSRIGQDTLVHKSKKDLWRISEDKEGDVIIERLFDPQSGEALNV
jgi:hypothetical protein